MLYVIILTVKYCMLLWLLARDSVQEGILSP